MRRSCAVILALMLIPVSFAEVTNGGGSDSGSAEENAWNAVIGLLTQGQARLGRVDISLGASATQLMCRCLEDDSCSDFVEVLCDPLGTWAPEANRKFFTPLAEISSDPSAAICALGHYGLGYEAPPGTSPTSRPDAFPADPVLSIEVVRWPEDSRHRYAIRYQFIADDDFDDGDYQRIRFTVRGSGTRNVADLAGVPPVGSASDLPFAASFSSSDLFTRACIRFHEAPTGLPREYCTQIIEVNP